MKNTSQREGWAKFTQRNEKTHAEKVNTPRLQDICILRDRKIYSFVVNIYILP